MKLLREKLRGNSLRVSLHPRAAACRAELSNPTRRAGAQRPIHERKTPRCANQQSVWTTKNLSEKREAAAAADEDVDEARAVTSKHSGNDSINEERAEVAPAAAGETLQFRWERRARTGRFTPAAPRPPASFSSPVPPFNPKNS